MLSEDLSPELANIHQLAIDALSAATAVYEFVDMISQSVASENELPENYADQLAERADILRKKISEAAAALAKAPIYLAWAAVDDIDLHEEAIDYSIRVFSQMLRAVRPQKLPQRYFSRHSISANWEQLRKAFQSVKSVDEESLRKKMRIQITKAEKFRREDDERRQLKPTGGKPKRKVRAKPGPKPPTSDEIWEMQAIQRDWLEYRRHCGENRLRLREDETWQEWRTEHGKSDRRLSLEYVTNVRKTYNEHVREHPEHLV